MNCLAFSVLIFFSCSAFSGQWADVRTLNPNFFKKNNICENAKLWQPTKPYALVAIKSHACDFSSEQHCLKETYYLSDRCNSPIQDNFHVYHLRITKNSRLGFTTTTDWKIKKDLKREWGSVELDPQWIFIDLKDCSVISRIDRKDLHNEKSRQWIGGFSPSPSFLLSEYEFVAEKINASLKEHGKLPLQLREPEMKNCLASRMNPTLNDLWDHLDEKNVSFVSKKPGSLK